MFRKLCISAALAGGLVLALPATAYADGYLDEATQALQSSSVYVSPQVTDLASDQQAVLISEIGDADIALVVLPANARNEIGDLSTFLGDVAARTGYDTVLVSVGGDFEAGSSDLPAGTASQIANSVEGGDLASGLQAFVQEVIGYDIPEAPAPEPTGNSGDGSSGVLVVAIAVAIVGAIGAGAWAIFRRGASQVRSKEKNYTPDQLNKLINDIEGFAAQVSDRTVADTLNAAKVDVNQLFKRLMKRAPDTIQQTTAQYKGILETVSSVLERIIDIEEHPQYYRNPESLLASGQKAIRQFRSGLIGNIQEIESGALTTFNVDTKILEATVREVGPDYLNPTNKEERH